MKKMTYNEFRKKAKTITDNFMNNHAFVAFNDEQFEEGLKERGLTKEDELVHIGGGIYSSKEQARKHNKEAGELQTQFNEMIYDDQFLKDAIYDQAPNHEYGYTLDPEDTLYALGIDLENLPEERQNKIFEFFKLYLKEKEGWE